MRPKLDQLREAWAAGDKTAALRIASRFHDRSLETATFSRGWDAHSNPDFYRQIGKDPAALVAAALAAMARKFKLTPYQPTETDMTKKTKTKRAAPPRKNRRGKAAPAKRVAKAKPKAVAKRKAPAKAAAPVLNAATATKAQVAEALKIFSGQRVTPRQLAALEAAKAGVMPEPPDCSAPSWTPPYTRPRQALIDLAAAGDVPGLKAFPAKTYDSGFLALDRYRRLCIVALTAKAAGGRR